MLEEAEGFILFPGVAGPASPAKETAGRVVMLAQHFKFGTDQQSL
ncbi:MAG: hypothetical protein WDO71_04240 [Bacteroidota bacterium]